MTYVRQPWIADALRAEGLKVKEYSGWKDAGRPSSTGDFDPYGITWHHTGTHTSSSNPAPTVGYCQRGNDAAPGPLCHVVIGYDGLCHVIAAGRANHAGESNGFGPFFPGDGNQQTLGFEIDYDGSQKMSSAQYDAAIGAAAACLRHFGRDESYAVGHKETSVTGKWDPGGYDCDDMRRDTKARLSGGGADDDMSHEFAYVKDDDFGTINAGQARWASFNYEGTDQGNIHPDGSGGIKAPYDCTMNGVVEVYVKTGRVDCIVERVVSGGEVKQTINRGLNLQPGYQNVPFAGKFPKGEYLYVKIAGDSDGSEVGSVRLNLDLFSV